MNIDDSYEKSLEKDKDDYSYKNDSIKKQSPKSLISTKKFDWFERVDAFLVHVCLLVFIQTLALSGYTNGINTTIERRFRLTSREIGLIYMSYEMSCVPSTILFGIFGRRLHRPFIIGLFGIIMSIGLFIFSLPHFITSNYQVKVCQELRNHSICYDNSTDFIDRLPIINEECEKNDNSNKLPLFFFCFAMSILGLGSSPLFVLGPAHLWDNLSVKMYSIYSAIFYMTIGIGPPFGFLLSGFILSIYIDLPHIPKCTELSVNHSLWLGAWWVGMLIIGSMSCILTIPMFKFKRKFPNNKILPVPEIPHRKTSDSILKIIYKIEKLEENKNQSNIESFQKSYFYASIKELFYIMKNNIWLSITMMNVVEQSIVLACIAYISKYLQVVYGIPVTDASFVVGGAIVPGAVAGLIIGGIMMHRLQPSYLTANKLLLGLLFITSSSLIIIMFLRCQNNYYLTEEIRNKDRSMLITFKHALLKNLIQTFDEDDKLNKYLKSQQILPPSHIDNKCNSKCFCNMEMYEPLCDMKNSKNYYSPCHAGCKIAWQNDKVLTNMVHLYSGSENNQSNENLHTFNFKIERPLNSHIWYTNCSCAPNSTYLISGNCKSYCRSYYFTLALVVITIFFTALGQVPINIMTLSTVPQSQSSMAMGVQMSLVHILAFIPVPLVYGALFDYACVLRVLDKCGSGSVCNEYDLVRLPYVWLGTTISMKALSVFFCTTSYLLAKRKPNLKERMQKLRKIGIDSSEQEDKI